MDRLWTPERRSRQALISAEQMETRKPSNTKPEQSMAVVLDKIGAEYVFQYRFRGSKFVWDFAIPSLKLLIEVDGCFWHGCPRCGFESRNGNDVLKNAFAKERGWALIRVKECELAI